MAACEAALESAWGTSELAIRANNLFGQKQATHPIYGTLVLPTQESINSESVTEDAYWVTFPLIADCFTARMDTLERLAPTYPHYALAQEAKTAEECGTEVSLLLRNDPDRP